MAAEVRGSLAPVGIFSAVAEEAQAVAAVDALAVSSVEAEAAGGPGAVAELARSDPAPDVPAVAAEAAAPVLADAEQLAGLTVAELAAA